MRTKILNEVLNSAPSHLQPCIKRLIALPLASKDELVDALNQYTLRINQAARNRGALDVNLAECISRSCLTLLHDCWSTINDEQRRLIQMACDYYIEEEDEEGDLDSVFGFDDDAELLNVVLNCKARERLGNEGLDIRMVPGGHLTTLEQPEHLARIIEEVGPG